LRESHTALASRGVIDLIDFIINPSATRCDALSSLGPQLISLLSLISIGLISIGVRLGAPTPQGKVDLHLPAVEIGENSTPVIPLKSSP
jgi:hypothetical protein